ncbi:Gag1p SKDI_12G4320 [Saccharomyces kudriavzevii IFO 1802]|uniref:Uncharacterized protein n=2 Tax=Saccharomyces kudriavzevii (strain ATCC MYA-4449 / AS 2.2408 / CBS 8840 / NBRC 1802 / NCYC 2889) TaxID=226230 RepID=A0AA35J368_SACK1|nr:uncharacterized protein SKDI_12G4320 [Saccharomyces kudriavzevii IFO 1802]EJT42986.1 YLR407W-like protein [Saccharomyces kudriavzevii IFO 1802]CAI4047063.1 hypothetical protein SKDI_12G4320 [Saccharomyces kudriavzevii IFO 1802]
MAISTSKHPKKNIKHTLAHTLQKWKETLKKITHETLSSIDDSSGSDEKIEALFTVPQPAVATSKGIDRDSGASMTQAGGGVNSTLEMKLTDESEESSSANNATTTTSHTLSNSKKSIQNFENYNAVEERIKLAQKSRTPFCNAEKIWKRRRQLWTQPTEQDGSINNDGATRREIFQAIPQEYYARVYKKLVVDDKPLREPLNLEDALQVINAGWTETKKWANAAKGMP